MDSSNKDNTKLKRDDKNQKKKDLKKEKEEEKHQSSVRGKLCNFCKKSGHLLRSCRKLIKVIKNKKQKQQENRERKFLLEVGKIHMEMLKLKNSIGEVLRRALIDLSKELKWTTIEEKPAPKVKAEKCKEVEEIQEKKKEEETQKLFYGTREWNIYQHKQDKNCLIARIKKGKKQYKFAELDKKGDISPSSGIFEGSKKEFEDKFVLKKRNAEVSYEVDDKQFFLMFNIKPGT